MKNYYDILGLETNASFDEIKSAYKALVKKFHPDVNPQQREFFEKKSKSINEAYETLSNSSKKSSYDIRLKEFLNRQQSSQANDNYNRQKEDELKRREEELRKKQNENDKRQREKEEELSRKQNDFDRKQREEELRNKKAQSTQKPVKEGKNRKPIYIAIGILLLLVAGFGMYKLGQQKTEVVDEAMVQADSVPSIGMITEDFIVNDSANEEVATTTEDDNNLTVDNSEQEAEERERKRKEEEQIQKKQRKLEEKQVQKEKIKLILSQMEQNMVYVQGGSFMMGSNDGQDDEKPVHKVTLSSFKINKYEVTQAQWKAVMGNNPSHFKGCANCPVESVSWNDIQDFLKKFNQLTGKNYRLLSDAEWEYAALGGNKSKGYKYAGSNSLGSVAWYKDNSGSKTHPIGQKQPNELGLYDMSGNVWESCQDWYDADYYSKSNNSTNPINKNESNSKVVRGGSWLVNTIDLRLISRGGGNTVNRNYNVGFRIGVSE